MHIMERLPKFLREFSKENDQESRDTTAHIIKAKRRNYFLEKKGKTESQEELQNNIHEREDDIIEQLEKISALKNEITELSSTRLDKIVNFFKLRSLRAQALLEESEHNAASTEQSDAAAELQTLTEQINEKGAVYESQDIQETLERFYDDLKIEWTQSEYTKEDITKYFSEEHLASLSLEEYSLLMKRFPREMVSHVTRQGVRDHLGHSYHTAGEGQYADGFQKIVEDGRLRSPLGIHLVQTEKEEAIARFLQLELYENEEDALKDLEHFTGQQVKESGGYSDKMAVHFATEEVADAYYGSERGNEIFIAYPSAFVASQYYFSGQLSKDNGGYWNDQWVWANEEKGIDINAGLVFIPKNARVDKKTGSRYELDEYRNPTIQTEYQDKIKRVIEMNDLDNFTKQADEILHNASYHTQDNLKNFGEENQSLNEKLNPFYQRLEEEFGIFDKELQHSIMSRDFLLKATAIKRSLSESNESSEEGLNHLINNMLQKSGKLYFEAKDTISSQEFWESYFEDNPEKKPSKIIYYEESDPTDALRKWREGERIHKQAKDKNIEFEERNVHRNDPCVTGDIPRFKTLAEKVIKEYFAKREIVQNVPQED